MKTYRGLVDIGCGKGQKACPQKYKSNAQAECLNCVMAEVKIVDHDRKPLVALDVQVPKAKRSVKSK